MRKNWERGREGCSKIWGLRYVTYLTWLSYNILLGLFDYNLTTISVSSNVPYSENFPLIFHNIPDLRDEVFSVKGLSKDSSHPHAQLVHHHQHTFVLDIIEGHTTVIFTTNFTTRHL